MTRHKRDEQAIFADVLVMTMMLDDRRREVFPLRRHDHPMQCAVADLGEPCKLAGDVDQGSRSGDRLAMDRRRRERLTSAVRIA